jgi:two-component system, response regulator, stage 0 sporulation protein F
MAQLCEKRDARLNPNGEILLVDDDPNHRELYSRRLKRLGYAVRTAESADRALEEVSDSSPHVVVLDLAMPGRDGLSLLQELVALDPSLPVIIHTAYPAFRDNYLTWTADAYIEKSSDLQPLSRAIARAIRQQVVA